MGNTGKNASRKGFENSEFRRAVLAFLREKCPEEFGGARELPVSLGLKIIRRFILQKQSEQEGLLAGATA